LILDLGIQVFVVGSTQLRRMNRALVARGWTSLNVRNWKAGLINILETFALDNVLAIW